MPKHDHRRSDNAKKKSLLASDSELATIEGMINRNLQPFKFSISRERERAINKQKYKRSEQIRSVMDNRKLSSIPRVERKETEPSHRLNHIYSSISVENNKRTPKQKEPFTDLSIEALINTSDGDENEITLQDVFDSGCILFY